MAPHIIAIVPIKKHSERLPSKNFREFNGRPLYHWILDTLMAVPEVDEVIVNTDAEEVMSEAPKHFDVEISERPKRLRDDETTSRIIEYEVDRTDADVYLHTYCTCPLLKANTVSAAINSFVDSEDHDAILPLIAHQERFYDTDMEPINHDPQDIVPTQKLPPVFEETSTLFIYTDETIERTGSRIGENPLPVEIGELEAIEIDYESDFELAEALHARRLDSDN